MLKDFIDKAKNNILYIICFLVTLITSILVIKLASFMFNRTIFIGRIIIVESIVIIGTYLSKQVTKNKFLKTIIVLSTVLLLLLFNIGDIITFVKCFINKIYGDTNYVIIFNLFLRFILIFIGYLFAKDKPYLILFNSLLLNFLNYLLSYLFDIYFILTIILILLYIIIDNFIDFESDKKININISQLLVPFISILISALIAFTTIPIVSYINPIRIIDNMIDASIEIFEMIEGTFSSYGKEWSSSFTDKKYDGLITNNAFIRQEDIDDEYLFFVDSSKPIERLKYKSYGSYDYNEHRFLDNDITDMNINYDDLFLKCDNHNNYVIITELKENKHVFYPYGTIEIVENDFHAHYDRCLENKALNINHYTFKHNDSNNISVNAGFDRYVRYVHNFYTHVPKELEDRLKNLLSENNIDYTSDNKEKLKQQINNFLSKNYTYTYEVIKSDVEPITNFLFNTKSGYGQHFASAQALLYRCCDIPARYTVGYKVYRSAGCRQIDADAWVEVFDGTSGWVVEEIFETDIDAEEILMNDNAQKEIEKEEETAQDDSQNENLNEDIPQEEENIEDVIGGGSGGLAASATITNTDISNIPNEIVVAFKCTNNEIERFKDYAYGDFNYNTSSFELIEDIDMYKYANSINFNSLFLNYDKDYLDQEVTINLMYESNVALVPYSNAYGNNITMYQDKVYRFNESKDKYKLIYHDPVDVKFNDKKYSKYVYDKYLNVPDELQEPLKEFLTQNNIDYNNSNKQEIIRQIQNLMQNEFFYSKSPESLPSSENVILYFLNTSKTGYCMHFASSSTLLLRMCGIPTRYVSGYAVAGYDKNGVGYCTSQTAHAWCEVYDESKGWTVVDTTSSNNIDLQYTPERLPEMEVIEPDEEIIDEIKEEEIIDEQQDNQEELLDYETIHDDENITPKILMIIGSIDLFITIFTLIYLYKSLRRKDKKLFGKRKYQYMNAYYAQLLNNNYKVEQASHTMKRIKYSSDTIEEKDLKEFVDYKYEYLSQKKGRRK